MTLTRRYRFSASHRLHSPLLSEAENNELYGKCNNPYGHGHDYILEVQVEGEANASTGVLMPVPQLDDLVKREVLTDFVDANMNTQIAAFSQTPPTTENVAVEILQRLRSAWPSGQPRLKGVRIFETRRNAVELQNV